MIIAFPGRFKAQSVDRYAQGVRERLLLECEQALSDEPEAYEAPLSELSKTLVQLLAPQSLHPQDAGNALLALERSYQDGVAELERAGHRSEGLTVYEYLHRLGHLERKQLTTK